MGNGRDDERLRRWGWKTLLVEVDISIKTSRRGVDNGDDPVAAEATTAVLAATDVVTEHSEPAKLATAPAGTAAPASGATPTALHDADDDRHGNRPAASAATPPVPHDIDDDRHGSRPPAPTTQALRAGAKAEPLVAEREPYPLTGRLVAAVLLAAIVADLGLRKLPLNNVAGALLVIGLAVGIAISGFARTTTAKVLLIAASIFGACLALRTEPFVSSFNAIAAVLLLILAAVHGRQWPDGRRSFWDWSPMRALGDGIAGLVASVDWIAEVPEEIGARRRRRSARSDNAAQAGAAARGIAIAAPIVLVFGLLLASADVVFESFFGSFNLYWFDNFIGHLALAAVGAWMMWTLLRTAATDPRMNSYEATFWLGKTERRIVLVAVNALFAAFAIAQLLTILGGADAALERAGLTPKQFARQGFFQLLWVAGLAFVLIAALRALPQRPDGEDGAGGQDAMSRLLSLVTIGLTLLIVVVAFSRILFYVDDGGLTPRRFHSAALSIWIAICFVLLALRILGWRPERAWLLPTVLVSAMAVLLVVNVANPEALVAENALQRNEGRLLGNIRDYNHFTGDGKSRLAAGIDRLSPDLQSGVDYLLCDARDRKPFDSDWRAFNLGRWRAERELASLCDRT